MKYIKTYESSIKKFYWRIETDPDYFAPSLYKIGMNLEEIKIYNYNKLGQLGINLLYDYLINSETILISLDNTRNGTWGWTQDKGGQKWYNDRGFKFMGNVSLTEEDIENYEIFISANKYNL